MDACEQITRACLDVTFLHESQLTWVLDDLASNRARPAFSIHLSLIPFLKPPLPSMSVLCSSKENVRMAPTNELLASDPTGLFAATAAPGLTFVPDYQLNMAAGMTPENLLYKPHPLMSVPLATPHSFCPPVQNKLRSVPIDRKSVV